MSNNNDNENDKTREKHGIVGGTDFVEKLRDQEQEETDDE